MTAKIIQFPHVLEPHSRTELQEFINGETTKLMKKSFKPKGESTNQSKAEIDRMVDNHDGWMIDLFLKLIDQIIEDNHDHYVAVQLLKLRYTISQYY